MDYLIDFILLAFIYVLFFYRKWSKKSKKHLILNSIIYVYIVMVLFVTVMPFTLPFGGTNNLFMETANFIPFRDLMANYSGAARELLLNVIMMMPFGFLYPISKKKGVLITVALTFLFSLIIESSQLLSAWWGGLHSRTFDVTDLITNTIGGLLGYLIFLVLRPAVQKILKEY
ncbi:VanZ family protein [Paenibacillus thiaminolyticus]|uniref:VanZ family protein n=1 Tax=Paenibacillus thiaminolyticus TaxID=49283 RepID=A0AAP9DSG5_PANTH|nr:VanZ family protein [Paenibacillus thiaminolyticus]MCY9538498.1 VanZ family protein [Paenibacillus thiaminolyticus]MCY9601235.1 VanZ family protein [Paenibacillus thiaminolyticus]MCY9605837.1 VanZ family protein [Paenibacillus thiaminolyticus]MCY9611284.1 VanZ family protein [Paenibacillus thiaminolyticus]MCY9617513.1 VanZ family protein [Paenibacillus thiaminolyticus]